jgi:type I restriction enzyme M protein
LTFTAGSPLRDAGAEDCQEDDLQDERQKEFLGTLAALGGSAGNGRLRDVLEWEEPIDDAVEAPLLSRGLFVPGRGRG